MGFRIEGLISILVSLWICKYCNAQIQSFNILQFGAVADSKTDNSKALLTAWSQACGVGGEVIVPEGTFMVLPLLLEGPCNGSVQIHIIGTLQASSDKAYAVGDHWLAIDGVNNLVVDGGGLLDGQGASAWPYSTCAHNATCPFLPVTLRLTKINSSTITNIRSINSKNSHLKLGFSHFVTFDNVSLIAPSDSPNTDGIDIALSTNISITNSAIATGDDCIALNAGVQSINITSLNCGPGHGISIGSLGHTQNEPDVRDIIVQNSTFSGTQNGVRIKTWSTPFSGLVSGVRYMHLQMDNVRNPIVIDQNYCPHQACGQNRTSESGVQIEDVSYVDIRGSSMTQNAVEFNCSQVVPCHGIVLQDINLVYNGTGTAISTCSNVHGSSSGQVLPPSCF